MDLSQSTTLKCLEQLSGAWSGTGTAQYPTTATFPYRETLTFIPAAGKPYLHFDQRTWIQAENGLETPSHWESGFWRALPNGEVELLCAQASGRVEVARGHLDPTPDGFILNLHSALFANDTRVEQTTREFTLQGSTLRYTMQMQTTAVTALTLHIQAALRREG